jgi:hypothetical protein
MEAMVGIFLYSYLNIKLAKTLCLSYYGLCLLFNKIGEKGRAGSAWKQEGWGEQGRSRRQWGEKVLKNTKKNDLIVLKRLKICNF